MTEIVAVAAEKVAAVVAALRHNIGKQNLKGVGEVDVERDIETVLTLLHNKMKFGVAVERRFCGARARGSSPELCQVWMNLITNAAQAMRYEGTLTITTESDGEWTSVSIADSGPGIPDAIRDHIFEPFFTTKGAGEGMGLGLDICKKIVDSHRGRISFESRPGKTSFTVVLPSAVEGGGP
jgi:signal transduction histidine kinase